MKKTFACVVAALVGFGVTSAFAGSACCPASKAKLEAAKAEGKAGCGDIFAKLNLTEDQKTKLAALRKECDESKCTESAKTKYMAGLKQILTAEQLAQCEAECKKAGIEKSCPMKSAEVKAETKS